MKTIPFALLATLAATTAVALPTPTPTPAPTPTPTSTPVRLVAESTATTTTTTTTTTTVNTTALPATVAFPAPSVPAAPAVSSAAMAPAGLTAAPVVTPQPGARLKVGTPARMVIHRPNAVTQVASSGAATSVTRTASGAIVLPRGSTGGTVTVINPPAPPTAAADGAGQFVTDAQGRVLNRYGRPSQFADVFGDEVGQLDKFGHRILVRSRQVMRPFDKRFSVSAIIPRDPFVNFPALQPVPATPPRIDPTLLPSQQAPGALRTTNGRDPRELPSRQR
jgi:hypothetical protein